MSHWSFIPLPSWDYFYLPSGFLSLAISSSLLPTSRTRQHAAISTFMCGSLEVKSSLGQHSQFGLTLHAGGAHVGIVALLCSWLWLHGSRLEFFCEKHEDCFQPHALCLNHCANLLLWLRVGSFLYLLYVGLHCAAKTALSNTLGGFAMRKHDTIEPAVTAIEECWKE